MREPHQVLVLPYRRTPSEVKVAVFRRAGTSMWQFVSGGGEDGESPVEAAQREMREELNLDVDGQLRQLDSMATIPKNVFEDVPCWDDDVWVIPEHCFAVDVHDATLVLSIEHDELRWVTVDQACKLLTWDSNRTALWELNEKLTRED
ncbi:NUDIX pyrophosphatase [Candidatus Bipolaricaulota bacterium]